MANTFKNYTGTATQAGATLYTVPGGTVGVIIGLVAANKTLSSDTISLQLNSTYIVKDAPLPVGSTLSALDGKIIAEAGDTIVATAGDSDNSVDIIISVLEQS